MQTTHTLFHIENIIKEMLGQEPNALNFLPYLSSMVDSSAGIIKYLGEEKHHLGDEPRFLTVRAELAPTNQLSSGGYPYSPAEGGRSLNRDIATLKALLEGAERYSLSLYKRENLLYNSYLNLISLGKEVIDPILFTSHQKETDDEYKHYIRHARMYWTPAWSWKKQRYILIPAQLVYLPYTFDNNEPILRDPLTTGAASGFSYGKAILRGLLEVLERDATTIIHYNSIPRRKINPKLLNHPSLKWLLNELEKCNLTVSIYDYSLDFHIPIIAVKIIDNTGIGPAITVGSKASFDIISAIEGAILEAGCFRAPMRDRITHAKKIFSKFKNDYSNITSGELRAYLWLNQEMKDTLNYLDETKDISSRFNEYDGLTSKNLHNLINHVIKEGEDILITNIDVRDIKSFGIKTVKVIVPKLQPMHLDESNICWTERMHKYKNNNRFNNIPHPFL
ncbi:YcaO-like family protein [Bacillus anthracis]|uniref:YcaO-like family protein n=1 Tax=Bacillus anthracis TaxID=1392 RepID=UPI00099DC1C0|nr:YcaO-like family protein [Bacillus anthracis]OPD56273.1 hypothetical protein BVG01_25010 [Bacillus anthracis]